MRLDAKTVAGLALPGGKNDAIFFDEAMSGFGLRLRASGNRVHRSWVAQYRAHGRTRRFTIGDVEKVTPGEARDQARKILARVELGGDPQGDKAAARLQATRTLRSVIDAYLEFKRPQLRPGSFRVTKLYLLGPYFKPLHSTSLIAITHADVAARLAAIKNVSGSVTAKQARTALAGLYKWAMGEGIAERNPVVGTNVPAGSQPRERALADAELVEIWKKVGEDDYGRIIRLLILLGSRRSEVGGMRWSELNLKAGTWTLPAKRSKNGHPHCVTLPPAALAIIQAVTRRAERDCLFGDRAAGGFTAWGPGKLNLDARLGDAVAPWRVHDLRRTCATGMGDLAIPPHVIEIALNHRTNAKRGVAGTYNLSIYQPEVAGALRRWSEHVLALVVGREEKVIPASGVACLNEGPGATTRRLGIAELCKRT
jgi:integrase